jgi:hypothetical protein
MKTPLATTLLALGLALGATGAHASVFNYVYTDTISLTDIPEIAVGQTAKITVSLDNGGTSRLSQTWDAATDLKSVTFDFNNGTLKTVFNAPWGGDGLDSTFGNFISDAGGLLTAVMTDWSDTTPGGNYTSNGLDTPFNWYLNGNNEVYDTTDFTLGITETVNLTNIASVTSASSWSFEAHDIPEPTSLSLMALGLAGLRLSKKRRAA